jgi:hypothetical protein
LRSLDGELQAEIGAEPTSDTTAGSPEAGEWWRKPDEQLAFERKSSVLPAKIDGLTRAAAPAGHVWRGGPAWAGRARLSASVLAGFAARKRASVLAGFAVLAILVAGMAGAVIVIRSDGSRPAGKIEPDRTTAPTTTRVPVTTAAPAPETSVPASSAPPPASTKPRTTTTTTRRTTPAIPVPAVTAPPSPLPPDTTPPPPDTTPPPPDTTPPPPTITLP